MKLEEQVSDLESRIKKYELEQAAIVAIEKNNKKWIAGISLVIAGVVGVSIYQLPRQVYDSTITTVNRDIITQVSNTVGANLNDFSVYAEKAVNEFQQSAARAHSSIEQKRSSIDRLEIRAVALLAGLERISFELSDDETMDRFIASGNSASGASVDELLANAIADGSRSDASTADQDSPESWITLFEGYYAKAGYFLPFGDNLRVNVDTVQDLNAEIRVSAVNGTNLEGSEGIGTAITLTPEDAHQVSYNATNYRITLTKIDDAGFNRFTKAAFFKVEQWN